MFLLDNQVQEYDWGSPTAIPNLLDIAPNGRPQAELWLGAHPGAPSRLRGTTSSLLEVVGRDPVGMLGSDVAEEFAGELPFLLKVLAAEQPLSLQAHPSDAQASAGYADEERRGVPRNARERNYKDPRAKPELLCALGPFEALCGFREYEQTLAFVSELDVRALDELLSPLRTHPTPATLRDVFGSIMRIDPDRLGTMIHELTLACSLLASAEGPWQSECEWLVRLATAYPADAGVLGALLLNQVRLQPGQALFLPAGNLHAYLRGVGIEIMGNSDNVLRGGLTSKHVDVPELLRVLDFAPLPHPIRHPRIAGAHLVYETPARSFELTHVELGSGDVWEATCPGPRIVLCTAGDGSIAVGDEVEPLCRGTSVFIPATEPLVLQGPVDVFLAAVPVRTNSSVILSTQR